MRAFFLDTLWAKHAGGWNSNHLSFAWSRFTFLAQSLMSFAWSSWDELVLLGCNMLVILRSINQQIYILFFPTTQNTIKIAQGWIVHYESHAQKWISCFFISFCIRRSKLRNKNTFNINKGNSLKCIYLYNIMINDNVDGPKYRFSFINVSHSASKNSLPKP